MNTKTAFEHWLTIESNNSPEVAAMILYDLLKTNPRHDNQVWDILRATGDGDMYTMNTFLKAARRCLQAPDRKAG